METKNEQQLETRYVSLFDNGGNVELRIGEGEQPHRFIGTIPYNALSVEFPGGWKERLMPGAFRSTLASGTDIRALVDHDVFKSVPLAERGTPHLVKGGAVPRREPDAVSSAPQ